ncbi:hypothetical protein [Streptomyces sp. B6B3]|uniref:hypothetical protein n=1 Tax=Streptomyces sp. B6B3 TaxID=3153570 RepID=UPI00325E64C4
MGISALRIPGTPGISGVRVARAAVFTACCVTLSTGAHVLLSGAPLPLPTVAAVAAAVFVLALALAGNGERRFWHIAALLIPLQLAADTVFTTGQATCYGPGGGPVTGPLRVMGVDLMCAGGDVGTPLDWGASIAAGEHAPQLHHPAGPWLLLAAHVAVGLAAAAWLRSGEAALGRLLRSAAAATFRPLLLAAAIRVPAGGSGAAPRRIPPVGRPEGTAPALPLLIHSVARRGPPPFLAPAR